MDKWKDAELEKMRAGGNRLAKEFLSSQPDWQVPDTGPYDNLKYKLLSAVLRIRIRFNADPDLAFLVNVNPDPVFPMRIRIPLADQNECGSVRIRIHQTDCLENKYATWNSPQDSSHV